MDKVAVLVSGGLDSSLVMAKLLKEGKHVFPFFGNYNQIPYKGEAKSVRLVVDWLRKHTAECAYPGNLTPVWPGKIEDVIELHIDTKIGEIAACPGRVLSFVGAICIWTFTKGWDKGEVAIGIHKGDADQDSCRVGYEGALDQALDSLTQGCLRIITPLMGMSREDMAKEIAEIGIPWEIMFNCYWGIPCTWQSINTSYLCPGCRRKKEAMEVAGIRDENYLHAPNIWVMGTPIARRDWTKWH